MRIKVVSCIPTRQKQNFRESPGYVLATSTGIMSVQTRPLMEYDRREHELPDDRRSLHLKCVGCQQDFVLSRNLLVLCLDNDGNARVDITCTGGKHSFSMSNLI